MRRRVCETNSLVEIQSTERVPRCGVLKVGSATLREFTKGQKCQTLSSGEIEYYAAVTTTAEALHLQHLLEFLEMPVKLRLRIDSSTAARGIIQRPGCGPLKHIETRLLWLQAKHEERKLMVVMEPTQTNTAEGFTKALQTAKYRSMNGRTVSVWDTIAVTMLRRASGCIIRTMGTSRSVPRDPTLSVGR